MCRRFSSYLTKAIQKEFELRYGIAFPNFPPGYNIAPGRNIPVVRASESNGNEFREMFWGLIPSFSEVFAPNPKFDMTLTRVESLDNTKKNFRQELLQTSRCIIPADNFFEWQHVGKQRLPFKFELKESPLMSLGAIYSVWRDKNDDGKEYYSCSIITVPPNDCVAQVHNRMPLIVPEEQEPLWLDRSVTDFDKIREAIAPYPPDKMISQRVSTRVKSVMNDDPELVEPVNTPDEGSQGDLFR